MGVGGIQLHSRAAQSIAVCTQEFSWMDNSKNISPCQVLASVDALCNNGSTLLPSLVIAAQMTWNRLDRPRPKRFGEVYSSLCQRRHCHLLHLVSMIRRVLALAEIDKI